MRIRILWLGKTRHASYSNLCQEYLTRIRRLHACELVILKESPASGRTALSRDEEKLILGEIAASPCAILLDVDGRGLNSRSFYTELMKRRDGGTRGMDFFLAGPWGWSDAVRSAAHQRWTLSSLTMPHELARVVFLEQLYRTLARIQGIPYEK